MKNQKTNPLQTVLTICIGFLVLYFVTKNQMFVKIATVIGVLGLSSNFLASKIDFLWMKLAQILGAIFPKIILALVFYVILLPISKISKLFNRKDNLFLGKNHTTTFVTSHKQFTKESFEKPF